MDTYLLTIAIGPVQSLIDSARRTRDLWCGSWLLSEAARAAAKSLHEQASDCLIFPAFDSPETELAPQASFNEDEANVANVIRAQIEAADTQQVNEILGKAQAAAKARMKELCQTARNRISKIPINGEIWAQQEEDILEIFSAWVKLKEDQYSACSERLSSILAARKATRDFIPAAINANDAPGFGTFKSSLDGARETVIDILPWKRRQPEHIRKLRPLGVYQQEQLDVLGVTKRMAGNSEQFTAFTRIAADEWIEELTEDVRQQAIASYDSLVKEELATRVTGNSNAYANFPYDAQLLYPFRLENALTQASTSCESMGLYEDLKKTLGQASNAPVPYAVVLKADGDKMGELLSKANDSEESRQISRCLHTFASDVRTIVRKHRGHAIYAGGDDVLAMLPLYRALDCAKELASVFAKTMQPIAIQLGVPEADQPSLSVGLGIGHILDPLGRHRERAASAEHLAKGNDQARPRNALAIQLGPRSGAELSWRGRWDETSALDALTGARQAFYKKEIPSRIPYELRAIALKFQMDSSQQSPLSNVHVAELSRTLNRARVEGGDSSLSDETKQTLMQRAREIGLSKLADELIIARWLSARTEKDLGAQP